MFVKAEVKNVEVKKEISITRESDYVIYLTVCINGFNYVLKFLEMIDCIPGEKIEIDFSNSRKYYYNAHIKF